MSQEIVVQSTGEVLDLASFQSGSWLDQYAEGGVSQEEPRLDALATISAGYRKQGESGHAGLPTVSRDGKIYLHDPKTLLYKVLNEDGSSFHGGSGSWPLPTEDGPGAWLPQIDGEIVPCQRGYHLLRREDVAFWPGPALFTVETQSETISHGSAAGHDSKLVTAGPVRLGARVQTWNERTMRFWACDCAEYVLPIYEREKPNDKRPREAIAVARAYARGEATASQLAAAWDAVRAAARAAAWDAAWDAVRAAARAAAWDAVRAAARAAAWDAAWDAARAWMHERLWLYVDGVDPMPQVVPIVPKAVAQ